MEPPRHGRVRDRSRARTSSGHDRACAPGPVPAGHSVHDGGVLYPTWSTVAPAFPHARTVRPVGGGYFKPNEARITVALAGLPQDLVVSPKIVVRQGARQGRVTTAPKAQMRWVRQGG